MAKIHKFSVAFWNLYTIAWLSWIYLFDSFSSSKGYSVFESISNEHFWLALIAPFALLSIAFMLKRKRLSYQLAQSFVFAFWATVFFFFVFSDNPRSTGTITYFAISVEFLILTLQTSIEMTND